MIGKLSAEWLNGNLSKAYPLADTTGGESGTLPSRLLVDGAVLSETRGLSKGYISRIKTTETGWSMSATLTFADGASVKFEDIISVSFEAECNAVAKFTKCVNGYTICGSFTIGDAKAVADWPGTVNLEEPAGSLSLSILHDISDMFITGIKVGNTTLTGTVELKAGEGIDISVDAETNTINITNTKYTADEYTAGDLRITEDAELVKVITDQYGSPIKSINGVDADDQGNINIVAPDGYSETKDYIVPTNTNNTAGTLILSLAKDPCLSLDDIATAADNLAKLNDRAAVLDAAVKELDAALNSIATQMTRLS